jgi:hypothetical protein
MNVLETGTKRQSNCRNRLLLMGKYVSNGNRITQTKENAELTHKLKKEVVYCYKAIPIQTIRESWTLVFPFQEFESLVSPSQNHYITIP